MAREILPSQVAGYEKAVHRENIVRAAACLGLDESICGVVVKPLTGRHVRLLALSRSPFIMRSVKPKDLYFKPNIHLDILGFLWAVSPEYRVGKPKLRDKFIEKISFIFKKTIKELVDEICDYVDEAYLDAPESNNSLKSYFAFEVSLVQSLYKSWGLSVDFWENHWLRNMIRKFSGRPNPLDVPLKIIWQFYRVERKSNSPDATVANKSDTCLSNHLDKMNKEDQKMREYVNGLKSQPSPTWTGTSVAPCDGKEYE